MKSDHSTRRVLYCNTCISSEIQIATHRPLKRNLCEKICTFLHFLNNVETIKNKQAYTIVRSMN